MSVSYLIKWPDGREEFGPIAFFQTVEQGWAPLARNLGLELVPRFHGSFTVWPDNLEPLLAELVIFRTALAAPTYPGPVEYDLERVDGLVAALEKLRGLDGWEVDIG